MGARRKIPEKDPALLVEQVRVGRAGNRCECEGRCAGGHRGRCIARHGGIDPATSGTIALTVVHKGRCALPQSCGEAHFLALCPQCRGHAGPERRPPAAGRGAQAGAAAWMTPLFDEREAA